MRSVSRWKHLAKYIGPVIMMSVICNIPILINMIHPDILKNSFYVKVTIAYLYSQLPIRRAVHIKRAGLHTLEDHW